MTGKDAGAQVSGRRRSAGSWSCSLLVSRSPAAARPRPRRSIVLDLDRHAARRSPRALRLRARHEPVPRPLGARRASSSSTPSRSAAWTLIAHMTMLTGLYPEQHGVIERTVALATDRAHARRAPDTPRLPDRRALPSGLDPARFGFRPRLRRLPRARQRARRPSSTWCEELAKLGPERPTFVLFLHLFDVHSDPTTSARRHRLLVARRRSRITSCPTRPACSRARLYDTLKKRGLPRARSVEAMTALYDDGIRHVDCGARALLRRLDGRAAARRTRS